MCGIAGVYFFKDYQEKPRHSDVLSSLVHRGPDFQSWQEVNNVIFYHTRLSIIGLDQQSNQPIQHHDSLLVFNGEIFNYTQFLPRFHDENLNSDTQVLVRLLNEEGVRCLSSLNGFFSMALYRISTRELFLMRDRFGIKPMYYYSDENKICFASEIRTLLVLCGKQELNENAIHDYFEFNYIPGEQTVFKNIFQLKPGHYIHVTKEKNIFIRSWYDVKIPQWENIPDLPNFLVELLADAVRLRLRADVPVAGFLSGGTDSSVVCGLAGKFNSSFKAFTLGFSDEPYFNENFIAEQTARYFGISHENIYLSNDEIFSLIPEFHHVHDQPFADSSALNIYFLCRKISGRYKVVLSGDGADELFKGYLKHSALLYASHPLLRLLFRILHLLCTPFPGSRQSFLGNLFRKIHKLGSLPSDKHKQILYLMRFQQPNILRGLLQKECSGLSADKKFLTPGPPFSALSVEDFVDLYYVLQNDMLVKTDRYSMVHGVEIRNPFLDYRVVEFALGLPLENKINFFQRKIFLKKAFRSFLPNYLYRVPKRGFEIPLDKWMKIMITPELFKKIFHPDKIREQGILRPDSLNEIFYLFRKEKNTEISSLLWALWVFQSWYDRNESWIRKKYA